MVTDKPFLCVAVAGWHHHSSQNVCFRSCQYPLEWIGNPVGMFVSVCRGGQLCVSCARLLAVVSWRGVLQFVEAIVH